METIAAAEGRLDPAGPSHRARPQLAVLAGPGQGRIEVDRSVEPHHERRAGALLGGEVFTAQADTRDIGRAAEFRLPRRMGQLDALQLRGRRGAGAYAVLPHQKHGSGARA